LAELVVRISEGSEIATVMSVNKRIDFEITCPNSHDQTVTFGAEEFEEILESGELVFHCNTCDTNWTPTSQEIAKFRKQLED